jgi:hypothetical protein
MSIMRDTRGVFTCEYCGKDKPVYWLFYARGHEICLWCAESMGLVKPRFMKGF